MDLKGLARRSDAAMAAYGVNSGKAVVETKRTWGVH